MAAGLQSAPYLVAISDDRRGLLLYLQVMWLSNKKVGHEVSASIVSKVEVAAAHWTLRSPDLNENHQLNKWM